MSEFSLVRYDGALRDKWDAVVASAKNGNFLHLRDYMDYHAHRFDDCSLIALQKGNPVAVLPCNRVEDRAVSHGGLTYGGLLYGTDLRAAEVLLIFEQIVLFYRALGVRTLTYKAVPYVFHNYPADEDQYALFRLGARLVRRDISSVIDLENRVQPSRSSMRSARKAADHAIDMQEGDFLADFHLLMSEALKKFGVTPVHSLAELRLLQTRFPDRIRVFGALLASELVAGVIVYDFGRVVHVQYGGNSPAGRKIGALHALYTYLIDTVFTRHRYFSFGISTEQDGRSLNEGLIQQKELLGARGVVHDFYELALDPLPN